MLARSGRNLVKVVSLEDFVLGCGELSTHRVSKEGVEMSVWLHDLRVVVMVESAGEHLFGEGDEIGRALKVPVLVGPELARGADSSLNLINDHVDAELFGESAESTGKVWGKDIVSTLALNRLDDDSDDFATFLGLPLFDLCSNIDQGEAVLLTVMLLVLSQRELVDGALCGRPIERWNVDFVNGICPRCRKSSEQPSMESTLQGQDGVVGRAW